MSFAEFGSFHSNYCVTLYPLFTECASNPCGDNGSCVDLGEVTFYCVCDDGWTARRCDVTVASIGKSSL